MTVWFASGNPHKKTELAAILNAHCAPKCKVLIPAEAGVDFEPEETGSSFHENALIKARALYSLLEKRRPPLFTPGDPVIADDSGICVDALGGRPGIYSARYAGNPHPSFPIPHSSLTSSERNALLLEELGNNPQRSARFVCAMALMLGTERFFLTQETLEGEIVSGPQAAQGAGGFGYDPIFFIPTLGRTLAELAEEEKNEISHRGKAGKVIAATLEVYR
ncbi:MAG: RdgB/HAM1 family non-canonical purine NTP pyrophosphatase [Treponema sp.]|jgi:XTP/dITP diphosphohydrolase|nr:RdgB/HAM1 family non-canonical purine NTP pyrophosphatase [Treponema sp.]